MRRNASSLPSHAIVCGDLYWPPDDGVLLSRGIQLRICLPYVDTIMARRYIARPSHLYAQVAELVDALVSGASEAIRGGSSPLLGTSLSHEQHR